jgi:hypothetical protein
MWNRLKDIAVLRDAISEACVNAGCDSSPEALESVTLDSPQWQSLALPSIAENSDFAKWDQAADLCLLWTVWVHGVTGKPLLSLILLFGTHHLDRHCCSAQLSRLSNVHLSTFYFTFFNILINVFVGTS